MKKRRVAVSLVLVGGICSALVGCSGPNASAQKVQDVTVNTMGFPIVNKPVKITMYGARTPVDGPWNQMTMFQQYQKMTKIDVQFKTVPAGTAYNQKLNLWFASNQLPDAFFGGRLTPADMVKYGEDGDLIPLDPLLKKYAPNIEKLLNEYPTVRKTITAPDGHIYALPDIVTLLDARLGAKPWINKQWLKESNLKEPTTTGELLTVLQQFKKAHPKDIPMDARNVGQVVRAFSGSWGLQEQLGNDINIQNGKVHIWLADPAFENELKFLNTCYGQGLLNNQLFTQTGAQYVANMSSGKVGLFFNQAINSLVQNSYEGMAPVQGPDGQRLEAVLPIARDQGTFAITKNDPYPAATLRWIDYFYGEQGSIFFRYGIKGKTYTMANGQPHYVASIVNSKKGEGNAIGQFTPWPGGGSPEWINNVNSSIINKPVDQAATNVLKPYVPKTVYGSPLFTNQEAQQVQAINQNLNTYVTDAESKFISGQWSFSKWPQYVANLQKLQLSQLQQIYQSAYSRMQKQS